MKAMTVTTVFSPGSDSCTHIRKGSSRPYSSGHIFHEKDGLWIVVSCSRSGPDCFGLPTWDVSLRPATPEDVLVAEVMES